MKKTLAIVLLICLTLCACGTAKPPVDLQGVYDSLSARMPAMLPLDETMAEALCGVNPADCEQLIAAICGDGLGADEIWLVRAKDQAALDRVKAQAEVRLHAKAEECESYAPDQYAIVRNAELVTSNLYLALLVGPQSAEMKADFLAAVK